MNSGRILAIFAGLALAVFVTGVAVAGSFAMINGTAAVKSGGSGLVVCVDKAGDKLLDGATPKTHIQPTSYAGHTTNALAITCP